MSGYDSRIAVIGAGAWGTALAVQAARAGHRVALWARDAARASSIATTRENTLYLPGVSLPASVAVTNDMDAALHGAEIVLIVVPAQSLRVVLAAMPSTDAPLILCCKGVERSTMLLPLEVLSGMRPEIAAGVLSGPNFAHEVARGLPAAAVVASTDAALRAQALAQLATPTFRLYGGEDPVGVEVGGAAKNVIAIAAGVVMGAGLGENARAALVTRGLAELSRLTVALGGRAETAAGLSGLGDLLLTATGPGSRNTSFGVALGHGETMEAILAARAGVTEGVATAPALVARAAQAGVEMPICAAVAALLQGRASVRDCIARLLARPLRDE